MFVNGISGGSAASTLVFGFAASSLIESLQSVDDVGQSDIYQNVYFICMTCAVGFSALLTIVSAALALCMRTILTVLPIFAGPRGAAVTTTDATPNVWREFCMNTAPIIALVVLVPPVLLVGLVMTAVAALQIRVLTPAVATTAAVILSLFFAVTVGMFVAVLWSTLCIITTGSLQTIWLPIGRMLYDRLGIPE